MTSTRAIEVVACWGQSRSNGFTGTLKVRNWRQGIETIIFSFAVTGHRHEKWGANWIGPGDQRCYFRILYKNKPSDPAGGDGNGAAALEEQSGSSSKG